MKKILLLPLALIIFSCKQGSNVNYNPSYTPDSIAVMYCDSASYYCYKGEFDIARQMISKSIELDSLYPQIYNLRSEIYLTEHKIDSALLEMNKVIELEPYFVESYINRGMLYDGTGKKELAETDYKKALEIIDARLKTKEKPELALSNKMIKVLLLIYLGDRAQAEKIFTQIKKDYKDIEISDLMQNDREKNIEAFFARYGMNVAK